MAHVHGAVLRNRSLLVATHDGLTSVDVVTGVTESVGDSRDDLMAFTQDPTGALFASGHAGLGSPFGEPMGLIRSDDAGRAWSEISLGGEADFHSLAADGTAIAGWATTGALLWSEDEGESWLPGPVTTVYSVALFKDQLWLAVPDVGLAVWNRDANVIEPVGDAGVLLAMAPHANATGTVRAMATMAQSETAWPTKAAAISAAVVQSIVRHRWPNGCPASLTATKTAPICKGMARVQSPLTMGMAVTMVTTTAARRASGQSAFERSN